MERIGGVAGVGGIQPGGVPTPVGGGNSGSTFKDLMAAISKAEGGGGTSFREIQNLQHQVLTSKTISPRDLIVYQIKVSQFGLHTELISKVAESASSTLKKLQSGQ